MGYCDLRIFHPRNALENDIEEHGYGKIMYHYRLANNNSLELLSNAYSMNRLTREKYIVYETISFSNEDSLLLQEIIRSIPLSDISTFEALYYNWEEYSETCKMEGDLWKLKKSTEYKDLLEYIKSLNNGYLLPFDKFSKGDMKSMLLIQDCSTSESDFYEIWKEVVHKEEKDTIMSDKSRINLYMSRVLNRNNNSENVISSKNTDTDCVHISVEQNLITVQMRFYKNSTYQIYIIDFKSNQKKVIKGETIANMGNYYESFNLPSGLYVVVCNINGKAKTQKIIIK